ncbi:Pumilio y domain family member 4 [Cyberlindnera fabianii]|uniref:Pumilio y domain family member 4 n=1 Tax=Cyberlindnera fabianii TaxID=36022 RepID=A0A1V2L7M0_CYBFA|nr:Pumilio y domain family member 4 [Cyberlindnera fabianii]
MSADNSANNSVSEDSQQPNTPALDITPPRSSSFSTPGASVLTDLASSKFSLFTDNTTPMQRSTHSLAQNIATAPPFLRDPNELNSNMPSGLVDINLAIGALDLEYGSRSNVPSGEISTSKKSTDAETADISSSSIAEGEGESGTTEEQDIQQHPFGPGLMHQPMHPFFPLNEFGQPIHGAFSPGEGMNGAQMNHPWPAKPGQAPFGGNVGLENMSHTPPLPPPGMIPMRPFDFHPDGMPPHMGQQGPMSPHEANFGGMPFGNPQMKDVRGNFSGSPNFPPMDSAPFGQQPHHPLQNSQMWPPLNGRPHTMDQGAFGNGQMPPNGMNGPNNGNGDRRYPYYNNGNNQHHHHHHNNNNNHHHHNRRIMNNRRRGEDAARFANAKLSDFIGQIYSLCKDQHGCRFLQKQLDLDASNATPIFEETQMHVVELMIDPFGNYLVQKLLEKVNDEQRITLVKNASPEFVTIALDPHGTRALQKLVECLNSDEEADVVVASLKDDIVSLSRDLNGNHVVQRCLQRLKSKDSQFIYDTAYENCLKIATHRHGCCVLQRCLDHGSEEQCKKLSAIIAGLTKELSLDAFGNYVVQYVLAKDDTDAVDQIVQAVKANLSELSLHKFGSNVIEKCLRVSRLAGEVIDELLSQESEMVKRLNDPYGNYVIQTALDVSKEHQFEELSNLIKPLLPQVRNTPHGRRIMARLQQTGKSYGNAPQNHHHHHNGNGNGHRFNNHVSPASPAVKEDATPAAEVASN